MSYYFPVDKKGRSHFVFNKDIDILGSLYMCFQDVDSTDNTDILDQGTDGTPEAIDSQTKQLELRVADLEREVTEKEIQNELLKKKVVELEIKVAVLTQTEQSLRDQLGLSKEKSVQEMCVLLETQHRELIRQQLKQVEENLITSRCKQAPARMIIINPGANSIATGNSLLHTNPTVVTNSIEGTVSMPGYTEADGETSPEGISLVLDCHPEDDASGIKSRSEVIARVNADDGASNNELLHSVKNESYDGIYERTFQDSLEGDRLQIEDDDSSVKDSSDEPKPKRRKASIECQNL